MIKIKKYLEQRILYGIFCNYWIADMLQGGSTGYKELEDYVNDIAGAYV